MTAIFLTEKDRDILRQVVASELRRLVNTPSRPPGNYYWAGEEDHQAPEVYIAAAPAAGIAALDIDAVTGDATPGSAVCGICRLYPENTELIVSAEFDRKIFNINLAPIPGSTPLVVVRDKFGKWIVPPLVDLVECCLAEDHPGRGEVFDVCLGRWDSATDKWKYNYASEIDCGGVYYADSAKAIDWRYDTPYPTTGAKGLFIPRRSDTYGVIYECVSLDCSSPGVCTENQA